MKSTKGRYLAVAIIPLFLLIWGLEFAAQTGPYWLAGNVDPDYAYLLNSLNIAEGYVPGHVDHPGTPLQIFGAAVLKLAHQFSPPEKSAQSLEVSVLSHSEFYQRAINQGLQIFTFICFLLFGILVLKATRSVWMTLASQAFLFINSMPLEYVRRDCAEAMLIPICILFAGLTVFISSQQHLKYRNFVILGLIAGAGVATKLTFLPLLITGLLSFSLIPIILYSVGVFIGFSATTYPIWEKYSQILTWSKSLAIHSGVHGQGGEGLPALTNMIQSAMNIWNHFTFLWICICALLIYLFRSIRNEGFKNISQRKKTLLVIILAILGNVAIVIKHPGPWYVLPGIVFSMALAPLALEELYFKNMISRSKKIISAATACTLLFLGIRSIIDIHGMVESQRKSFSQAQKIESILAEHRDCQVIEYFRSPSLPFGLLFGNIFADRRYSSTLSEIYKDFLIWNHSIPGIMSWTKTFSLDETTNLFRNKCVIFAGTRQNVPGYEIKLDHLKLSPIYEEGEQGVYWGQLDNLGK